MKGLEFYQATWWKSECVIQSLNLKEYPWNPVDCVVPTGHLRSYDPFDFYHSVITGRKGQVSLPYLFGSTSDDARELKKFCTNFGIPNPRHFPDGYSWEELDDEQWTSYDDELSFAERLRVAPVTGTVRSDIIKPCPLPELCEDLYKFKNFLNVVQTVTMNTMASGWKIEHPRPLLRGWHNAPMPKTIEDARMLLEQMLASAMGKSVRPRIAWNSEREQWVWTWEALSLTSLMYLMVALDLQGSGMIRCCQGCSRFFLAERRSKVHCAADCQNISKARMHYRNSGTRGASTV